MFKINGIEMSSPTGCTWQLSDLSSDESGRSTRDGSMSKDIIAQKRTLNFTWTMFSWVEASKLANFAKQGCSCNAYISRHNVGWIYDRAIYDYSGNAYKTYITNVTFNIDNKMQIACDAETFNEKNRAGGSQSATIIAMAKKQTEMQISEYDIRVQQMNRLATNAMGYYETIETQDDGSIICYMHDKENLSDSKTIWKKTVDSIFISSDGGKTYIAGVGKNGNAVLKILATEGIVADWINAGTLNANLIKPGTLMVIL